MYYELMRSSPGKRRYRTCGFSVTFRCPGNVTYQDLVVSSDDNLRVADDHGVSSWVENQRFRVEVTFSGGAEMTDRVAGASPRVKARIASLYHAVGKKP